MVLYYLPLKHTVEYDSSQNDRAHINMIIYLFSAFFVKAFQTSTLVKIKLSVACGFQKEGKIKEYIQVTKVMT